MNVFYACLFYLNLFANIKTNRFDKKWLSVKLFGTLYREASALTLFCFMFTFAVLQFKETLAIRMPYSQDFTLRKARQTSFFSNKLTKMLYLSSNFDKEETF